MKALQQDDLESDSITLHSQICQCSMASASFSQMQIKIIANVLINRVKVLRPTNTK